MREPRTDGERINDGAVHESIDEVASNASEERRSAETFDHGDRSRSNEHTHDKDRDEREDRGRHHRLTVEQPKPKPTVSDRLVAGGQLTDLIKHYQIDKQKELHQGQYSQ